MSAIPLDEHDPFATVFLIQNTGPWDLYNLRFGCMISPMHLYSEGNIVGAQNEAPSGQRPVEKLSPGETITRDCLFGPAFRLGFPNPATIQIDVIVKYQWPLIPIERKATRHFSVRRSPNGQKFLLVPDTAG
jgi:hypothetical protein